MKDSSMSLMCGSSTKKGWLDKENLGPLSTVAKSCVEQKILLVTKLDEALPKAGYEVKYEDKKNGSWCKVFKKEGDPEVEILKAQGYSSAGREDALLHAMFGAVREEDASNSVGEKLDKKGIKVDETLRAKLEQIYILEGSRAVDSNLDHFKV